MRRSGRMPPSFLAPTERGAHFAAGAELRAHAPSGRMRLPAARQFLFEPL